MASTEQWQAGQEIGTNHVIEEFVARGGMGVVYRARHKLLGRTEAIKTIRDVHAEKPDIAARFLREGQLLADIDHPNVVKVYDLGEHEGVYYMAMEWLDGETLQKRLDRGGALGEHEAARLLVEVCAGIAAAHAKGVVHRDLKPENVFLVRDAEGRERVKVVDFGIARGDVSYTATDQLLGTPHYMSPEQWSAPRDVTAASDQFSLGVIAYQCVTGRRPFRAEGGNFAALAAKVQSGQYTPPRELCPALSERMCAAIERLLRVDPERRYGSMREVGAALISLADEDTRGRYTRDLGGRGQGEALPTREPPVEGARESGGVDTPAAPATMPLQGFVVPVSATAPRRSSRRAALVAAVVLLMVSIVALDWWSSRRAEGVRERVGTPVRDASSPVIAVPARPQEETSVPTPARPTGGVMSSTIVHPVVVVPAAAGRPARPSRNPRPPERTPRTETSEGESSQDTVRANTTPPTVPSPPPQQTGPDPFDPESFNGPP